MVYKCVLCLLLMIQVKNGRCFLMLNSPTSIYYKKIDASSSTEQPRAVCRLPGFLMWRYFTTGCFTTEFSLLFEAGLPFCFLHSPFFLTAPSLPSFLPFVCLFFKNSFVSTQEEYTKEIEAMISSQVELKINLKRLETWNIKRCMDRDRVRQTNLCT